MADLTPIGNAVGRIYDNIDRAETHYEDIDGGPYVIDLREAIVLAPYYVKDAEGAAVTHGLFMYSSSDEFGTEGILRTALRKIA